MEYGVPQWIVTPSGGTVTFNDLTSDSDGGFLVQRLDGLDGAPIRTTIDPLPQKHGALIHPFLRDARYFSIEGLIVSPDSGARGRKRDELAGALDEMLDADGRYYFIPAGGNEADTRFLTVRHYTAMDAQGDDAALKRFTAPLVAYDPVIYHSSEGTPNTISGGGSVTINNEGKVRSWPVLRVYSGSFELVNETNGFTVNMDGITLGLGEYVEINMQNETAYLNGNSSNLLRYLDFDLSNFWPLEKGDNTITMTGSGSAAILWNSAWA